MNHSAMIRIASGGSLRSMNGLLQCIATRQNLATKRHPTLSPSLRNARTFRSTSRTPPRRQQSTAFLPPPEAAAFSGLTRPSVLRQLQGSLRSFLLKPRTVPVPRWVSPHHYTITLSEISGHASFILVAASYAMDDFLQLRIIAVAGSTAMLFFTYFHPHGRVLWLPFKWNLLFIAINASRIGKVYWNRFKAETLPDELAAIRNDHFYVLDPVDFYKLVQIGRTETFNEGDLIIAQGNLNRYIRMVVDGELKVVRDGMSTYNLEEGNFVSEVGLHAGLMLRGKVESCCTIVATKKTTVLCWDRSELMDFLQREKAVRSALKAALSWDIVRKLKGQRQLLAEGKIDHPEVWTQKRNEQNNHRYAAILQNMLYHPQYFKDRKEELNKYRMIHHIDDEHHRMALKQCGWTPQEFEAGFKEGQEELDDDDEEDIKHDFKWRLHDLMLRVIG